MSVRSTTVPPAPKAVALASMKAPGSMESVVAAWVVPWPIQSLPIKTLPPPKAPVAEMLLLWVRVMWSASRTILPPTALMLLASIEPELLITPAFN